MSSRWGVALLFVLSFLYFLTGITQVVDVYDEGIPVYGAQRVLEGDVPYRDFWTIYAPGQFYVLAGLFKLFSSSLLVERLYDTAVRALISVVAFAVVQQLASLGWGLVFWLVVTVWLKFFGYYASSTFPALLFALTSLGALFGFLDQRRPKRWLFISGLLVGTSALFRHDFGFYTFISEILVIVVFAFRRRHPNRKAKSPPAKAGGRMTVAWPYLLGFGVVVLPVFGYFLSAVPAREIVYDLVTFPVKIFPQVRKYPFPAPLPDPARILQGELSFSGTLVDISHRWAFYFPSVCFAAAFGFLFFAKRHKLASDRDKNGSGVWGWKMGLLLLFGVLSFNNVRIRSDLPHLMSSFFSAGLLFAALIARTLKLQLSRKSLITGLGLGSAFALLVYPVFELQKPGMDESFRQFLYSHNLKRAGPVGVNPYQADAIHYIQGVTYPWEPIFVGNNRHDLIYNNDVMFYFLSERRCAGAYQELSPGSATSPAVQNEIINALRQNNVRYIVLLSRFENPGVTNELVPVRLLDDFIAQNYQPVEKFGDWSVWKAK